MGVLRFRVVLGGVLMVTAAYGVAASRAGTVSAIPESDVIAPPTVFDHVGDSADVSLSRDLDAAHPIQATPGTDASTLELFGDFSAAQPAEWSPNFEGGSATGGSAPVSGSVLSPVPDQVLIPLPSAAWTGLTGLAGLGLVGMMKHVRRFFT